jgi:glycogen debranching enzyme
MTQNLVDPKEDAADSDHQVPAHYIEAQTSLVERALRTLKCGDAFVVLDGSGDILDIPGVPEGLFYRDTRYLSAFDIRIDGQRLLLLSSVIQDDNACLSVDLTNPDLYRDNDLVMPRNIIAIERSKLLWEQACYERIGFCNYDERQRRFEIVIRFESDFKDLFELRGAERKARGTLTRRVVDPSTVELRYDGLDRISRFTRISFSSPPVRLDETAAVFEISLEPDQKASISIGVTCNEGAAKSCMPFGTAYIATRRGLRKITRGIATVESSNAHFNEVVQRSTSDMYMLVSHTEGGLYPYAGIPWFSTVFGRDGIITAMMMLWVDPTIARGVLRYLADTQATTVDPVADAQPGKILHERRHGEMAHLAEVPFRRYYGTVDATPLYVMLAGMYLQRTGDRASIAAIWPNILAALNWCDHYGDRDGDGFVEYYRQTESGLANQGWKDSQDSIFHANGDMATGPIALCEVQGYVYAAKLAAAEMAEALGYPDFARTLTDAAATLRQRFQASFWCEDIGTYALALDGAKNPCRVRSSNAGHALFTGIADVASAVRVAATLTSPEGFSGWGLRTIAQSEVRYNPMSYHNGSIWPHDNALIALGFARYGLKQEAARVFTAMFDAAMYQDLSRLPELFCGFVRRPRRGPTAYPVACSPQAWAAAAPFAFVAASLGLELRHDRNEIRFNEPCLPEFLSEVILRGIRLGASRLDVRLDRVGRDVTVAVLEREGDARLVHTK